MDIISAVRGRLGTERTAVSYSGGFDSTLLLHALSVIDPDGHAGVFVDSPLVSERQRRAAMSIADSLGLRVVVAELGWEDLSDVRRNTPERCYHCKRRMYGAVIETAADLGISVCADGENKDDLGDCRPGRRAARELGVVSPFADLGIGRDEIERSIALLDIREMMIKDTCMATRIRIGTPFSDRELRLVEDCESIVRKMTGVRQLRVRLDGDSASVMTSPAETDMLVRHTDAIVSELRRRGLDATVGDERYGK